MSRDERKSAFAPTFTPREIVSELDRYIVGQEKAKRAVAVALRNRWRRQRVTTDLRDEIAPKNILMIGPTGVGKTEIARRIARLAQAPFLKVEASKYTEVGYVGRDVDSIVRDLLELAIRTVRAAEEERVRVQSGDLAEDRLVEIVSQSGGRVGFEEPGAGGADRTARERLRSRLRSGELDGDLVEMDVADRQSPAIEVFSASGMEEMDIRFRDMFANLPGFGKRKSKRKVPVREARRILAEEEAAKLVDMDAVIAEAKMRTEQSGIVFIDEIDKVAGRERSAHGPDVSREGVQRDLLPLVEGTTVVTKHGPVRTDHILFIAAGAFHVTKPSDLIPELQGRFPIRVELHPLDKEHFVRILREPRNALLKQHVALLETENVGLSFTDDAVDAIAAAAAEVNRRAENIGARRLHTVMEAILDELSFTAPERPGEEVVIDGAEVVRRLAPFMGDSDLARYIL